MATVPLTVAELEKADLVPGTRHLRINRFGERVAAFMIETQVMEWRRDHSRGRPAGPVPVSRRRHRHRPDRPLRRVLVERARGALTR
jgi:hypothetical protein